MIQKFSLYSPQYDRDMPIHVWVPDNLEEGQKAPALYMFDGQNLFLDEDATYGTSWNLAGGLENEPFPLFVIGIECSHEGYDRLEEYSPYPFYDEEFHSGFRGLGQLTMDFILEQLIPWAEENFPIEPVRTSRWIAGSSCGALMALYGLFHESETFSKAVCLSPYVVPVESSLEFDLFESSIELPSSCYFSWGTNEGENAHEFTIETRALAQISTLLSAKGVLLDQNVRVGGTHSEYQWGEEVPLFLDFLLTDVEI